MNRYYITDINSEKGFIEVTETEFYALMGSEETRSYIPKVYRGELSIDEVPEKHRETVQAIVDARIARFGLYKDQPISPFELQNMIEGVM